MAKEQIAEFRVMNIDFYPKESRVVTFRDPWSFPVLFHPGCNHLIRSHLEEIAQKVRGNCILASQLAFADELGRVSMCMFRRIPRHPILSTPSPDARS